jgi:acetolactate synthase-1/2/3 large subunit
MNGAQSLARTLCDGGLTTCFMNPSTSEMHFVAALDTVPEMRAVLCLFEGVATGCADGYARMTGISYQQTYSHLPGDTGFLFGSFS